IRKVFSNILISFFFFSFSEPVKDYVHSYPGWYWASYALFFATYLILSCCSTLRRKFPWNLIFLTVSLSYMTGMLSSFYDTKSVVLALGITAAVCFLFDITSCHGVLFVLCMVMFISGVVLALVLPFNYVPWLDVTYAVLGAMLFIFILMFDTQLIMGKYTMSPEEYVFATLSIYMDITYIFSFFLKIFGTKCHQNIT
uniref:Protein lifeguard 2 n=1 Tax=Neogobius melanostomus TaxID=47308 RepID=A0A8C6THV6_9GOBI